jgi:hypothetical protein
MKKVYEQSLGGLRISTGTYHVMPDEYDKLNALHNLLLHKSGIDMHYTSVCVAGSLGGGLERDYLASKYDEYHHNIYVSEFRPLLSSFLHSKQTAIMHKKLLDIIKNVKDTEEQLVMLTVNSPEELASSANPDHQVIPRLYWHSKMEDDLNQVLNTLDKEGQQ